MTYITSTFTIIITLCLCHQATICAAYLNFANTRVVGYTRNITIKQGSLQGEVVRFLDNSNLPEVERFKGIPYAAPPIGAFRFMPSGTAPWFGTMFADRFGPVCPQNFPDIRDMPENRLEKFLNLRDELQNQSEDCLYLNIYAPHPKGTGRSARKYPVMVYIHGESFEWNSGNPYDGSVLAAYGKVIVITLNYRLGVLGFLKADTDDPSKSNFGLVDQIAALVWIQANIAAFGGDPDSVTIFGHGTGAVCVNLLMLSPMALQNDQELFRRAILMGGSALSDWALVSNPLEVSYQVAQAVNCPIHHNFSACLGRKRLDELLSANVVTAPYKTRFGPVVDGLKVPNEPSKLMTTYSDIFRRFDLMYGVTEMESINLLGSSALENGIMEKERDQELRKYFRYRCEMKPEGCLTETLAEYADSEFMLDDEKYGDYRGHEPDRASVARDMLLDILSDARTVAPMVQMGKFHAAFDQRSYFYVFTHKTRNKEHPRHKSSTGDELPFVFGVPLGDTTSRYTEEERLFSEVIMTYFCNFAFTGDPKVPRKDRYLSTNFTDWIKYMIDWPNFDLENQQYLELGIPPYIRNNYREGKMKFWNEVFPKIANNTSYPSQNNNKPLRTDPIHSLKNSLSWPPNYSQPKGTNFDKYENFNKPMTPFREAVYGDIKLTATTPPDNMMNNNEHDIVYGTVINSPPNETKGISTTIIIAMGSIFLLCNILCLFLSIYYRRYRKKKRSATQKVEEPVINSEEANKEAKEGMSNGCNIMKMVSKSSRSDDTYEAVKSNGSARKKLPRQMSNSTIDAHTKVRDWITNEIVYKYSPRFLRRHRHQNELKIFDGKNDIESGPANENNSTLGRSPTRPVSPNPNAGRPPLVKSSSIPVNKTKKPEKVSVAVDATPSGRGNSVLQQQPIELTKSLDRAYFDPPLRRSLTLEDFSCIKPRDKQELRKSTTSINLKPMLPDKPEIIRIAHSHSKSEPVQDIYSCTKIKKLKTFDPNCDVNVTSRDESTEEPTTSLTPEEALMTIKRRNFPKVLPDYPSREALAKKRRSMPVANHLFMAIPEIPPHSQPHSPTNKASGKLPPAPPQRTTSTLSRKNNYQTQASCQSAPMLAQDPPRSPEPEVTCNNLYFGPLIPKLLKTELSSSESSKLNTQPIYESLRVINESIKKNDKSLTKTVITTDPNQPIRKIEPKVIIKPSMVRSISDPKKNVPRVLAPEGVGAQDEGEKVDEKITKLAKASQIPLLVKTSKESSSSESTSPSEESDTGTVVKKM